MFRNPLDEILKKQKYFQKTLSKSAVYITFTRMLDIQPLFAKQVWLNLLPFDLAQLGVGLTLALTPNHIEPVAIDFTYELPSPSEVAQGIIIKFKPIEFETIYDWMADIDDYVSENIKDEHQTGVKESLIRKCIIGRSKYGMSYVDPLASREFLRSGFIRLKLLRTPNISWKKEIQNISTRLNMREELSRMLFNRLSMLMAAQEQCFVLGLAVLGKSRLSRKNGDYAEIETIDYDGNVKTVKFATLDHLQMGFILGMTPLGYGLLMPKTSVYKQPEGKKNPPALAMVYKKMHGIISRATMTTWSYTNYQKPQEMRHYLKNPKTDQYHALMKIRDEVEKWVERQVPREEHNPVRLRQYKNAVLQALFYRVKRHRWGFGGFKSMSEDEYKEWWKSRWKGEGLNEAVLEKLYEGMGIWLAPLQRKRVELGEKVQREKKWLASASPT